MDKLVSFEYRLLPESPGWAACHLQIAGQDVKIDCFSGAITDPLDDLLRATLLIVTGAHHANCRFDDEPEPQWVWTLDQRPLSNPLRGELTVKITRYDTAFTEPGDEVLLAVCNPDAFAAATALGARAVLDHYGRDGFLSQWGGPFPVRALTAIEAALSIRQPTPMAVDPRHWGP